MYKKYKYIITSSFSDETYNDIINRWSEPHRFYHNLEHLNYVIEYLELLENRDITTEEMSFLILVAFFHDVIYNPKVDDNESKSVAYFLEQCKDGIMKDEFIDHASMIIMDTRNRKEPKDRLSKIFWNIDNSILSSPITELIEYENKIFKEFQWVSYDLYKEKRIEFLQSAMRGLDDYAYHNVEDLTEYIKNRKINVGVYAGSFNPFHIGHYNILQKSMEIFDKVIIAFGVNPEKDESEMNIPSSLDFIETTFYDGLVTDLLDTIQNKGCNVTLLRGIRNGADLSYESNQLSFIKDLRPNTNVIFIPADKEFEHISSSAIRNLRKFDEDAANKYLV